MSRPDGAPCQFPGTKSVVGSGKRAVRQKSFPARVPTDDVHLKDAITQADGQTRCVPIDSGSVPYADQFNALLSDGYDGLYTIETHYIPEGGTPMQGTAMTLQGLRNLLKRENLE